MCNGGGRDDSENCCTRDYPCDEFQGSCQDDSHCAGKLKCGRNNCNKTTFHWDQARCCQGNCSVILLNKYIKFSYLESHK